MKKYSIKTAANRAARLLRNVPTTRANAARYSPLRFAYTDAQGRQIVTDSFRAYRFTAPVDGLPEVPADMRDGYPNIGRLFIPYENGNRVEVCAPEIDALKEIIKARKEKHEGLYYSFGDGFPTVNAKYLLELLETFPGARLYAYSKPLDRLIKPIYAVSEHGDALLTPLRIIDASKPENAPTPAPAEQPAEPETLTPDEFAERYACAA